VGLGIHGNKVGVDSGIPELSTVLPNIIGKTYYRDGTAQTDQLHIHPTKVNTHKHHPTTINRKTHPTLSYQNPVETVKYSMNAWNNGAQLKLVWALT